MPLYLFQVCLFVCLFTLSFSREICSSFSSDRPSHAHCLREHLDFQGPGANSLALLPQWYLGLEETIQFA